MSGAKTTSTGTPELAQLLDRLGRVEVVAAGDDEVGPEADDLLDVDGAELGDVRDRGRGLGG